MLGVVGGLHWVGGLRMGSSDRAGHDLTYGTGSMAACIGLTLAIWIQVTAQPWRLYLFVLLYGPG